MNTQHHRSLLLTVLICALGGTAAAEKVAPAKAGSLSFSNGQLQRIFAGHGIPKAAAMDAKLRAFAKKVGYNDGSLRPRDLVDAPAALVEIMNRVYARTGKRRLLLDEVTRELSPAVIASAHAGKNAELSGALGRETLTRLSADYETEVLGKGVAASEFARTRKLTLPQWRALREAHPELFREETGTEAERTDRIAALYAQLRAKKISGQSFYRRARIGATELKALQATDPERFPREPGAEPRWAGVGHRRTEISAEQLAALSKAWKDGVVARLEGRADFLSTQGMPRSAFEQLQRANPKLFPEPETALPIGMKPIDEKIGTLVGEATKVLFARDVLATAEELVAGLNGDKKFVAAHGSINQNRFDRLRERFPAAFPRLDDVDTKLAVLAGEVKAVLAERPGLSRNELTSVMAERHPSFRLSRLDQLRKAYPALFSNAERAGATVESRHSDAELLARMMESKRGASIKQVAALLQKKDRRYTEAYAYRLRAEFRAELFTAPGTEVISQNSARTSRPVLELYRLAARVAPPGATVQEIGAVVDQLLVERGLPAYGAASAAHKNNLSRAMGDGPGLSEMAATTVADVLAEYAGAAKKDSSEAEILVAFQRDYPSVDMRALKLYRTAWEKNPAQFPSLRGYIRGHELTLVGQGKKIVSPRYLGGWDARRALLGGDKQEVAELAKQSEFARIQIGLPVLDQMVADLGGKQPLRYKNVLMVSHLLGSTFALALALQRAGAGTPNTIVVGTPYGTNPAVRAALESEGLSVRVSALDAAEYKRTVENALDDAVAKYRQNHFPVVVLDDGGLVTELLHEKTKYADVRSAFKIVEQTTRGITAAEQRDVETTVVNVARSRSKQYEGQFIGRAVAEKVGQGLRRLGSKLDGATVVQIGFGIVGSANAEFFEAKHANVLVVEANQERATQAKAAGYKVVELDEALEQADVVVGATGAQSMSLASLRKLKSGAVVVSASSKQVEIDMEGLKKAATKRTVVPSDSPLVRLPTVKYRLGSRELTLLGDGWPVNFDGDVEDIPGGEIQLTRATMFAGAIQAAQQNTAHKASHGVLPLDAKVDERVLSRFKAYQRAHAAKEDIGDPDRWADAVLDIAGRFRGETVSKAQDLLRRARLGDRALAQQIAAGWPKQDRSLSFAARLEEIVGAPFSFNALSMLRDAHPDLLGSIDKAQGTKYTPEAKARIRQLMIERTDLNYDELGKLFDEDPLLKQFQPHWTREHITGLIKRNPEEFPRRNKSHARD